MPLRPMAVILTLVGIVPLVFSVVTLFVARDIGFFSPEKNLVVAGLVGAVFATFGVADSWSLFFWDGDKAAEADNYMPAALFSYVAALLAVVVGYAIASTLSMSSPWLAGLLGLVTFACLRMGLNPSEKMPRIGRTVVSKGMAVREIYRTLKKAGLKSDDSIVWGEVPLPQQVANTHFAVVGVTGGGKSITIQLLLQQVLPRDRKAIIYDAKRDIYADLAGMDLGVEPKILNPLDQRAWAWDIRRDLQDVSAAGEIAEMLIPEQDEKDKHFPVIARAFLKGVFTSLITRAPDTWTFRDVLIASESSEVLQQLFEEEPTTANLVRQFFSAREFDGFISTLGGRLERYRMIAAAWEHCSRKISLEEWIKSDGILLLGCAHKNREALTTINQLMFQRLHQILMDEPPTRGGTPKRTWVVLDEAPDAGNLKGLDTCFTHGRGYGICVVVGFQDIGLMERIYGSQTALALVGQCASKALLRIDNPRTREWAASLFDKYEDHSKTQPQYPPQMRNVVEPTQFKDLPVIDVGGLQGYYLTPWLSPYFSKIPKEKLFGGMLKKPKDGVANFVPRNVSELILQPWNDADYKRLRLRKPGPPKATNDELYKL